MCFVLLVLGSSYYDAGLIVVYFYKGAVLVPSQQGFPSHCVLPWPRAG
jgi:hypothetical protein